MGDPNISNEDKMKLLQETLSDEAKAAMEKLLADGYTMDEVMKLMAAHGNDVEGLTAAAAALSNEETEFKKKMKELAGGKDLSDEQMLELMKSQLGAGSKAELEALLAKGVSLQDAMNYMGRHGKTEEEEAAILAEKIRAGMEGKNMTDREKIEFLRHNLSDEAKAAMEELLAQGYTMDEVIELFKKHGNNLNAIDAELTSPSVNFEDEPEGAHLYANRDVFSVIDRETVKDQVPFMSPSIKNLTFKQFIDKVQISYTFSDEFGLHLVLGRVEEESYAYQCGVREGDIIVYVNGWLITVMDKPQVAVSLFQAGANIVTLGILKASDRPHDIIAFAQGQTPFGNMVGVY